MTTNKEKDWLFYAIKDLVLNHPYEGTYEDYAEWVFKQLLSSGLSFAKATKLPDSIVSKLLLMAAMNHFSKGE